MNSILIHPIIKNSSTNNENTTDTNEFVGLVKALQDIKVCDLKEIKIKNIISSTFLGQGKIDEIKEICKLKKVKLSLFNCILSPIQQRNLENKLNTKVLDRQGLILEIFGDRAITKEGVLQVELAHLKYQKSRLVRSWTHLERQKGGIGFLGGPGEKQIESDRRQISSKIQQINKKLKKVIKTRNIQRLARVNKNFITISIVGYTNSGKSSLFNKLTKSSVLEKDMLFSTLDTKMKKINYNGNQNIILSDTVGFISNLPLELISAFKATLEEIIFSDIILHVTDISNPNHKAHYENVNKILYDIDEKIVSQKKFLEIWNKIDLLKNEDLIFFKQKYSQSKKIILTSAKKGIGIDYLKNVIVNNFINKV